MDIMDIMRKRHSVRQYGDRAIEADKRAALDALTARLNGENGMHIQMLYDEPKCFDSFMARYGNFTGVRNYIALVGKRAEDLEERLGRCGEELVLKAQELGLNTCWVALTHGKSGAEVGRGEKPVCLISLGYGKTQGVEHSNKPLNALCSPPENMPDWFQRGMEAVLLAPTAMNQQKFFFELAPDGSVRARCGKGFYTKLDLGIAKHHFEAATGRKIAD